jgi:MEMO1 family protein
MIRQPVVAGRFYADSPAELRDQVEAFMVKNAEKADVVGVVMPHAGYVYSGAVAGAVVSRIQMKDTFIVIGPNHTGQGEPLSIMSSGTWKTPLGDVRIDTDLAKAILSLCPDLKEDILAHQYEHSIEVQLPFLQYYKPDVKLVPIMLAVSDPDVLKTLGLAIAQAIKKTGRETVILASSDMSHYESQKVARQKDRQAILAMLDLNPAELIKRVEENHISMCGYAPATVMLWAVAEMGTLKAELIKYQTSGDVSGDMGSVVGYAGIAVKHLSPLVKLAKEALETYVKNRKILEPTDLTPEMQEQAGVFVCIKKFGELRGCIGTFEPTRKNVAEEIVDNAIGTAVRDPRFEPVEPSELKDLDYTVDVLTQPEMVKSKEELDARKYGVIVAVGNRRGLLLPDLEGVDTVDEQIDICRQKGGIDPDEPVKLYRFEVKRYH